jgi:hypothetical protein
MREITIINILIHMEIIDMVLTRFSGLITVIEIMAAIEAGIPDMAGIMTMTVFMEAMKTAGIMVLAAGAIMAAGIDKT